MPSHQQLGFFGSLAFFLLALTTPSLAVEPSALQQAATTGMRRAAEFYRDKVAVRGGYVYYVSPDLKQRWGEGVAERDEIWVQMPGTPAVGLAYLAAYRATKDAWYLAAAKDAAQALIYGQLASGGWTYSIDFDPQGKRVAQYRNGKSQGRNYSTLDDGVTQGALQFLMRTDQALEFQDAEIKSAARLALDSLLAAQFGNGGFPQAWTGPASKQAVTKANFPDYDWRTENRVKEYWNLYTLNDGLTGHVADTLLEAATIYDDERCRRALERLGDFLILAQLPDPQPAWSQQYDFQMRPCWARRFEPPAVTGSESQDAIETLLKVHRLTGKAKYLEPIPRALAYLQKATLPDGRLARFYELQTNKPLYMTEQYELTYDDANVPSHYGWKVSSRLDRLDQQLAEAKAGRTPTASKSAAPSEKQVREVLGQLDGQGRWLSRAPGERLVGQPKFAAGKEYLASEVFVRNLELLAAFVAAKEQP